MKKTVDIILRTIIVSAILGAIGYYYYGKFAKPVLPAIKSPILKLPEVVTFKPKTLPKAVTDNSSKNNIKSTNDNKSKAKLYTFVAKDIISPTMLNQVLDYLKNQNIPFEYIKTKKKVSFTRVLIGPILKKTEVIKKENILKNLKIEIIRLRIKGKYYIHTASFADKSKLEEFVNYLKKHKFYNIKFMKVDIPKEVFSLTIHPPNETSQNNLKEFLNTLKINYILE